MTITLLDGYYIDIDAWNYSLKRKTMEKKKDGTEYEAERIIGHFGSLRHAVYRFLDESQQSDEISMDLETFAARVEKSNERTAIEIAELLEKVVEA